MHFTDRRLHALRCGAAGLSLVAGCSSTQGPSPPASSRPVERGAVAQAEAAQAVPAVPQGSVRLAAPATLRTWAEVRHQAARRLVEANPGGTYMGVVPDVLLAIAVLEIELNGDGSIRRIDVLRKPRAALDTVQLAVDAARRAGPFGDVSRLPKPWRFAETFLFNDERRFKPRTLD